MFGLEGGSQHLRTFPKFRNFLIMKATLTNIIGNFEYQSRACSEKISSRGKPRIGAGGEKINETLIGGGSPHLFCTLPDPANVIFMLCFEIYDAVFFLRLCFKYSKFVNSCGLCEL